MTSQKLESMILVGRGLGTGDRYTPWLLPHKRSTSTTSNISYVRMPMLHRHCYFLSRGERHLSHLLWWAGAEDVREQFPLWPWPHPNPLAEVDPARNCPMHPGMTAIARAASIVTHCYPNLPIPTILTLDLMVTVRRESEPHPHLLGISCKPHSQYIDADPSDRLRERLQLDRLYCQMAGIAHHLVHPEFLPTTLIRQLEWLAPLQPRRIIDKVSASCAYQKFVERLSASAFTTPASVAINEACRGLDWSPMHKQFASQLALWRLDVVVDLDQPISMASPLPKGSRRLRDHVRSRLFGDAPWN